MLWDSCRYLWDGFGYLWDGCGYLDIISRAMRRGFAPNPGLRWWLCFWLLFGPCITPEQCRPRRHSNVAQDDTAMSPTTTQQCRPRRHQPKYKSNRNTEPKGGSFGVGFGLCFTSHLSKRETLGQAQECACTGLGAAKC